MKLLLIFLPFLIGTVQAQKQIFFQASFGPVFADQDYEKAHKSAPGTERIGNLNFGSRTTVALMFRDSGALNGWSFGLNRYAIRTHQKVHVLVTVDYINPYVPVVRSAFTGIFSSYTFKRKFRDKLLVSPRLELGIANHRYTQESGSVMYSYDTIGPGFQYGYESKRNLYSGLGVNFERRYYRKNQPGKPGHLSLNFGFFYARTFLARPWEIYGQRVNYFRAGYRNMFAFDLSLKVDFEWIRNR